MGLRLLVVGAGGAIGAIGRYLMTAAVHRVLPETFPYGTLAVNMFGSLVVGLAAGIFAERAQAEGHLGVLFLIVGICGGFTTFSAFSADTYRLIERGAIASAAINAAAQGVGALVAVFAGFWLARQV
ncbi:MAG: fluoride efflux transporter CrcB [Acidobacteria bacterium]|jgi:fluoride exporter|nr:fluoride efflux transporter CrcB [Acidobacteriota bacterium]